METRKTNLPGVLVLKPPTVFEDFRGSYVETYSQKIYRKAGVHVRFVQDDISVSPRHVLRGLHGDDHTWKLISCLYGQFYLIVLNYDKRSKAFGKWESFVLSDRNRLQVLVPPKYANGHLVMTDQAMFHYKQSTYYSRASQFTVPWDDPRFKIWWPVKSPITSLRDESCGVSDGLLKPPHSEPLGAPTREKHRRPAECEILTGLEPVAAHAGRVSNTNGSGIERRR